MPMYIYMPVLKGNLKGNRMTNKSTSHCPFYGNSLAHIFLLFTFKSESGITKVMSAPVPGGCKTMKKDFSNRLSPIAYEFTLS